MNNMSISKDKFQTIIEGTPSIRVTLDDCLNEMRKMESGSVDSLVTDPPAGISFMNQSWDSDKGSRDEWIQWLTEIMSEAYRVMKAGSHGLVWALPKTSGWTHRALENAGFEVRDCVDHVFGTGFPKNHNIPVAIDKKLGFDPTVVGEKAQTGAKFKLTQETIDNGGFNDPSRNTYEVTEPTSDEAKQWSGWGTALKPAKEHWWLIRKPLDGSIADNLLEHGVGAINIDDCKIGDEIMPEQTRRVSRIATFKGADGNKTPERIGRWPSNIVFSHHPDCKGYCVQDCPVGLLGDDSRFFYCAKPSAAEKEEGLQFFEPQTRNDGRDTPIDNAYQRGETQRKNHHPTVKSLELMTYLIKMVTPPKKIVFDPFMGSGSTGVAAIKGGWSFVGIEQEPEFYEIAKARIIHTYQNRQINLFD